MEGGHSMNGGRSPDSPSERQRGRVGDRGLRKGEVGRSTRYETAAEMVGGTRGAGGSSEIATSTGFDGGSTASASDRYQS